MSSNATKTYIKLKASFYGCRKTLRLRSEIGDDALWIPPRLWVYASTNQMDGDFSSYSSVELAMALDCPKYKDSIFDILTKHGFMDADKKIHDWEEHAAFHKKLSERGKKGSDKRWGKDENSSSVADESNAPNVDHAKKFTPPTLEEVQSEAVSRGWPALQATKFHSYYESNGWRVGKNPMKSWKHAMTSWQSSDGFGIAPKSYSPRDTNPSRKNENLQSKVLSVNP